MKKKQTAALLMAVMLAFAGAACGNSGGSESTDSESAGNETAGAETDSKDAGDIDENGTSKKSGEPIQIATKPMTEQYILGEMLKLLIEEDTDYTAEITKGIGGGTSNIHPAMEKGEFDLYPEYTSSGWVMVLKHEADEVSDEEMLEKLKEEYEEQFDMTWVGLYGFNNTFAVAVRKEAAEEYDLKTTSDMAAVSDKLVFGGNPDYIEREDGFNLLCETYGMDFKDVRDIDIGLKYEAMEQGDIDVTNGFTTDAQLSRDDIMVLEDDKHLQVNYFCSTVVRQDTLEKYPGLEDSLMKMDGILTDQEMAELNYQVEVEGKDEAEVAEAFLKEKGLM
ncbi:glycine betaine ABC transporter substrate-binding protein [Lachnospiraceae bacterium 29-91]